MDGERNNYLEKVDRCLRAPPVSERIDIVNEIKSEMVELTGGSRKMANE